MFKDYYAKLLEIKNAVMEGRIGDALRLNAKLQEELADVYDMLVGNRQLVGATAEDNAECDKCKNLIAEIEKELDKNRHTAATSVEQSQLGLSPIQWIAVIKQGIDFAKILIDAWRNRQNP